MFCSDCNLLVACGFQQSLILRLIRPGSFLPSLTMPPLRLPVNFKYHHFFSSSPVVSASPLLRAGSSAPNCEALNSSRHSVAISSNGVCNQSGHWVLVLPVLVRGPHQSLIFLWHLQLRSRRKRNGRSIRFFNMSGWHYFCGPKLSWVPMGRQARSVAEFILSWRTAKSCLCQNLMAFPQPTIL
jgi:hypothetical protein